MRTKQLALGFLALTCFGLAGCSKFEPVSYGDVRQLTGYRKQDLNIPGGINPDIRYVEVCISGVTYFASRTSQASFVIGGAKVTAEGKPLPCGKEAQ